MTPTIGEEVCWEMRKGEWCWGRVTGEPDEKSQGRWPLVIEGSTFPALVGLRCECSADGIFPVSKLPDHVVMGHLLGENQGPIEPLVTAQQLSQIGPVETIEVKKIMINPKDNSLFLDVWVVPKKVVENMHVTLHIDFKYEPR